MWPSSDKQSTSIGKKNADGIYETDPEKYGTQFFKATLDYQWYVSRHLKCLSVLDLVDESVLQKLHACPNQIFPSDHLMIKSRYCFF